MVDRVYEAGESATAPTAPMAPTLGYPKNGNSGSGTPATMPGEWWYHMITEELMAVIIAAGLTPDHANVAQLLASLQKLDVVGDVATKSIVTNSGYIKLPGGLILQWGNLSCSDKQVVTLPISFPTAIITAIVCDATNAAGPPTAVAPVGYEYDTGTTTSFKIRIDTSSNVRWIAIGY